MNKLETEQARLVEGERKQQEKAEKIKQAIRDAGGEVDEGNIM